LLYNQTGVSPKFSQAQLDDLGIKIALVPNALTRRAVTSMYDLALELKKEPLSEVRSRPSSSELTIFSELI
jgi:2-methylisocitrate lyase-like PEP mutase family enzyme